MSYLLWSLFEYVIFIEPPCWEHSEWLWNHCLAPLWPHISYRMWLRKWLLSRSLAVVQKIDIFFINPGLFDILYTEKSLSLSKKDFYHHVKELNILQCPEWIQISLLWTHEADDDVCVSALQIKPDCIRTPSVRIHFIHHCICSEPLLFIDNKVNKVKIRVSVKVIYYTLKLQMGNVSCMCEWQKGCLFKELVVLAIKWQQQTVGLIFL